MAFSPSDSLCVHWRMGGASLRRSKIEERPYCYGCQYGFAGKRRPEARPLVVGFGAMRPTGRPGEAPVESSRTRLLDSATP